MKMIPSALVCMLVIVVIEFAIVRNCGYSTLTLKDIAPFSSANAYPRPFFINDLYDMSVFTHESVGRILLQAIMLSFMAILETAMTQEVVNEYTNSEGELDRQFFAMGFFYPFFNRHCFV